MKRINWNAVPWLIIAIVALAAIAFFAMRSCQRKKENVRSSNTIAAIKADTVEHWQDHTGRDHGSVRLAEADVATLKNYYPHLIDSLKRMLRIKDKQLQAATSISVVTAGEVIPRIDTVYLDGKQTPRLSYSDRFLKLEGTLSDPPLIQYETFDSLIVTTYWKRKNFLSKRVLYVDAVSLNPNAHVSGMTGLRVADAPAKKISIGPFVGYGFDGKELKPTIGIGLQYSLIRF